MSDWAEEYRAKLAETLSNLPEIEKDVETRKVESWDDYRAAMTLIGDLNSLYCWAFNSRNESFDRISAALLKLQKTTMKWCKSQTAKGEVRLSLRYLLWNKYLLDDERALRGFRHMLAIHGRVWKYGDGFALTGLHFKLGDNTFSDSFARNRQYLDSCGAQAFKVENAGDIEFFKTLSLPELPDFYEIINLCDGKGAARPICLTRDEIQEVYSHSTASVG